MKFDRSKTSLFLAAVIAAVCAVFAQNAPVTQVRVSKTRVNLRAKPMLTVEVAGQVEQGTLLNVKSMTTEWVEVEPPEEIGFWIHRDYVTENRITGRDVNVRAGPGKNFSIVGMLDSGDAVETRDTHAEWVKIAPVARCSLWVHRSLVEPVAAPAAPAIEVAAEAAPAAQEQDVETTMESEEFSTQPDPAEDVEPAPSPAAAGQGTVFFLEPVQEPSEQQAMLLTLPAPDAAAAPKPAPSGLDVIPLAGQGKGNVYEGVLRRTGYLFRRPSPYRLVVEDDAGRSTTLCYVMGNTAQLESLLGRKMRVSGGEYWVHGKRHPVVVLERIVLSSSP